MFMHEEALGNPVSYFWLKNLCGFSDFLLGYGFPPPTHPFPVYWACRVLEEKWMKKMGERCGVSHKHIWEAYVIWVLEFFEDPG